MSFWSLENIKSVLGGAWLARPDPGERPALAEGLSTDSRSIKPGQAFLALRGESTDGHKYLAQAGAAGSPLLVIDRAEALPQGLPRMTAVLKVDDTGAALLKLAAAYRKTLERTRVIAVGGSNGKTTTVRLISAVLSRTLRGTASAKSFNNAVGVPLTILSAKRTDQYLVCEIGTNAPGEIAPLAAVIEPDIAVITSIGREHLEGLGSLKGVLQEEASLLPSLRPGGTAVLCADAPGLVETARALVGGPKGATILTFGNSENADIRVTAAAQSFEGLKFRLNDRTDYTLPLLGEHNACNAAAAIAVARRLGVENADIEAGLATAKGPEMRLERSTIGGIHFINDAYNANPESVLAAIKTFDEVAASAPGVRRRVIVLGDMLELGGTAPELHREVGRAVAGGRKPDLVILVGELSRHTREGLVRGIAEDRIVSYPDLEADRALRAVGTLRAGDLVLLKGSRRVALERIMKAAAASAATEVEPRAGSHTDPLSAWQE